MEINHGGVDAFMAQQVFDGHDIEAVLKQVGGIGVPECVDGHLLDDACVLFCLLHGPLHASLGIPAVEVASGTSVNLLVSAVEEPHRWLLGFEIGLHTPDGDIGKRDVAVLLALSFPNMEHLPVEIKVADFEVADFKAAQAAVVEQSDQYPVFEQFGSQQQPPYLFPAQYDGKFLAALDRRKLDAFVL